MAKKKNEADRDTPPKLPISVCINVGANGKLSAIRFSPEAAAKISRAKGFPHYDLSPEEKRDKLRKLLDYDFSSAIQRGSIKQVTYFNPLASCYFPHMWDVRAGGKRTSQELFHDGEKLPWAMGKHNKLRDRSQRELREEKNLPDIFGDYSPPPVLTLSSRRKALRTYSGTQGVSNFSPAAAAAIYHHLLPEQGGIVFDPSCGWGGRLLGAIGCDKVHKYIGCDPSTETYKGLLRMRDELVPIARSRSRNLKVELYKLGSEMMRPKLKPKSVDLAFSSPPYFAQEQYSDEPTQSWVKYKTRDAWLTQFIGDTLANCAYCLKPDGFLAVNIASVSTYKGLQDDFVAFAESKGWKLIKTMKLALSVMPGTRGKQKGKHKHEPIFIFKKK